MGYYNDYPKYVPVAEKRELALKKIEKLRKKHADLAPVLISGRSLARTWWGKSWNTNLESYADYTNRISRGRSYVRNCAVVDLKISEGVVDALVQGSTSKPYQVMVAIHQLAGSNWETLIKDCTGKIDSLQELMAGKFPKALSEIFTTKGSGLFPAPKEITFSCSCPDGARMCKHVAATLYGVGARLDDDPTLFFRLRGVQVEALISDAIKDKSDAMLKKSKVKSRRVIEETDMSDLFGIDMD